jgi:Tfp pilus assembly PilM family ATPase
MDTSIYFANGTLRAVAGSAGKRSLTVEDAATLRLPEGALINGVITGEDALAAAIHTLREEHPRMPMRNVRLAFDSSMIYFKQAELPRLPVKRTLEMIRGEFSEMEEELLYDYAVLNPRTDNGGMYVLLNAVKRELIMSYIAFFQSQGITLSAISTALSSQIKLVRALPSLGRETFIMLVLDGNMLGASLYVEGEFRFANRARLFAERGSKALEAEIERTVSTLIQFNQSEKSGATISHLYLCGLTREEEGIHGDVCRAFGLKRGLLTGEDLIHSRSAEFDLTDYIYATGNLLRM